VRAPGGWAGAGAPQRVAGSPSRLGDHLTFDQNLAIVRDGHLQRIRSHHPLLVALDLFPQRPGRDPQARRADLPEAGAKPPTPRRGHACWSPAAQKRGCPAGRHTTCSRTCRDGEAQWTPRVTQVGGPVDARVGAGGGSVITPITQSPTTIHGHRRRVACMEASREGGGIMSPRHQSIRNWYRELPTRIAWYRINQR
jgi:hypothetical protein